MSESNTFRIRISRWGIASLGCFILALVLLLGGAGYLWMVDGFHPEGMESLDTALGAIIGILAVTLIGLLGVFLGLGAPRRKGEIADISILLNALLLVGLLTLCYLAS